MGYLLGGIQARSLLGLLVLTGLLTFGFAEPAQADCVLNGTLVICSGASPNGFTAGGGQNGLSVNVQSGATVGNGTTNNITLNDNNTVMNFGSITVGTSTAGILAGNNNSVSNFGTITAGDFGAGIAVTSGSIFNAGTVIVGAGSSAGLNGPNATNTGLIQAGDGGIGVATTADSGTAINRGTIIVGDGGQGIASSFNSQTIVNSGTIVFGGCGFGIQAVGTGNNISNSGTISVSGCSGGGLAISAGNSNTIVNSGTIFAGDTGVGIFTGANANITNTGRIVAGFGGTGILANGSDSSLTNSGTIIVGDSLIPLSGGMVADGDRERLVNTGTIIGGLGTPAMIVTGNDGVLFNSGTITVGDSGGGLISLGNRAAMTNTGTIVVGADGFGIQSQGNNAVISNSGTVIFGACGIGIDTSLGSGSTIVNSGRLLGSGCSATGVAMGAGDTLTNSGVISASFSITSVGTATVMNSGVLDGAIALSGPNSALTNAGLITVSLPFSLTGAIQHTIDGSFTQTPTGTLALRVTPGGGAGSYDSLAVSGAAGLGGTLRAQVQPGLYGSQTIYPGALTFASSTGRFTNVTASTIFFNASANYNAGGVDLVLSRIPFNQFATGGANARAVGNILEANYSTSLTGGLASFYSALLQSTAPNTLSQLTGEVATASQNASFAVFGQFLSTVFGQTASVRALGGAAAAACEARQAVQRTMTAGGGTRLSLGGDEACSGQVCDTRPSAHRYTAWAQGFGGAGSIDGNGTVGSSRLDMNSGGGATGIDLRLDADTLVGVTMGTASAAYDLSDLISSGTARSIIFGVYGGHSHGPAYIDGALAYGYSTFTTNRVIGTGSISEVANASFDGYQYGGRVEGGWRFGVEQHLLTPFAALTVQAFQQSGYTENSRNVSTGAPGVLGVTVQGQTATSVRSTLGAQFETSIAADDGNLFRPRVRLGWGHEYNTNRSATVSLSSVLPGAPFQVTGAQAAADSLVVGAGFDVELGGMVRLYGQFDSDISSNARAFAGTGGVRLIW